MVQLLLQFSDLLTQQSTKSILDLEETFDITTQCSELQQSEQENNGTLSNTSSEFSFDVSVGGA